MCRAVLKSDDYTERRMRILQTELAFVQQRPRTLLTVVGKRFTPRFSSMTTNNYARSAVQPDRKTRRQCQPASSSQKTPEPSLSLSQQRTIHQLVFHHKAAKSIRSKGGFRRDLSRHKSYMSYSPCLYHVTINRQSSSTPPKIHHQ